MKSHVDIPDSDKTEFPGNYQPPMASEVRERTAAEPLGKLAVDLLTLADDLIGLEWRRRAAFLQGASDSAIDAEQEIKRLREALEFYAQQYGLGARLASDGGKIARKALEGRTQPGLKPPQESA